MNFIINGSQLTIKLGGMERIWAFKSNIIVNKKDVIQIHYADSFNDWRKMELRVPGTALPGVFVAGSFWTNPYWDFLYLTKLSGWFYPIAYSVLVIETKVSRYNRIIVSCNQADAAPVVAWGKQ